MTEDGRAEAGSMQQEVGRQLGSRFSTAVVLFHAAIADRVGLNVTDFKCAEILLRIGPTHPGRLAEITGMSSAATAQVLGRLERVGLIRREPDATDRRRILIHAVDNGTVQRELAQAFGDFARRVGGVINQYDERQLGAIADFIARTAEVLEDEALALRRSRPRSPVEEWPGV